ncbi:chaperone binding ATPase activators [Euphorbia peplus]|nr:chaperone binding ATPase activators [Euphorbia peplus]
MEEDNGRATSENGGGGEWKSNVGGGSSSSSSSSSYTYWVREVSRDAAPLPLPKKLDPNHLQSPQPQLGSLWNRAGTWEEKNLNQWATHRINDLLLSLPSLDFSSGNAQLTHLSKCSGDAFLVTVRNKKRVGYTYELALKIKGEWIIKEESKNVNAHIDIPEFSFGELDDLQMEVQLSNEKDLLQQDKLRIKQDLKLFLQPVREKLLQFEQELKDR